jgi:hypothetical protein
MALCTAIYDADTNKPRKVRWGWWHIEMMTFAAQVHEPATEACLFSMSGPTQACSRVSTLSTQWGSRTRPMARSSSSTRATASRSGATADS